MALTFKPSLQHLATVRLALTVYNDDIMHFLDQLDLRKDYKVVDPYNFNIKEERWVKNSIQKARKKLCKCLPKSLLNTVLHILQPIVEDINFWARDHFDIIEHIEKSHYKNIICWGSSGIIDRRKTAEQLIKMENIDKRMRFYMACIYFRKNDVLNLCQSMTTDERKNMLHINSNTAVNYWIGRLRKYPNPSWTEGALKYLSIATSGLDPLRRIRLSSFFSKLKCTLKIPFFRILSQTRGHIDDLRLCYNLLNENERAVVLRIPSMKKDLLLCYLDWPLQSLFLDAIKQMKNYLNCYSFEYCMEYIVY
ncbi:unnamed protein product, partial [Larinioides sclopetarius]